LKILEEKMKKEEMEKELIKNMNDLQIQLPYVDKIINTKLLKKYLKQKEDFIIMTKLRRN